MTKWADACGHRLFVCHTEFSDFWGRGTFEPFPTNDKKALVTLWDYNGEIAFEI